MQSMTALLTHCTVFDGLAMLTLQVGAAARLAQPGHWVAIDQMTPAGQAFLLRNAFVAAADPAAESIELWCAEADLQQEWPNHFPGLTLTLYGFFGTPISLSRAATVLLVGAGPALAALFFLANRQTASRNLVFAQLPEAPRAPLQRLPAAVEVVNDLPDVAALMQPRATAPALLIWADQVVFALPYEDAAAAVRAVRTVRLRWESGYAWFITLPPAGCVTGVCRSCRVMTRRGPRLLCRQGPLFDLRDL